MSIPQQNILLKTTVFGSTPQIEGPFGIQLTIENYKLEQQVLPRFAVVLGILLKSMRYFQQQNNKRMLQLFIQLLEGCQIQQFEDSIQKLFTIFIKDLKSLSDQYTCVEYIYSKLLSGDTFVFALATVANIIYTTHNPQGYLYAGSLQLAFSEFNLDFCLNQNEVQPNTNPILIQKFGDNLFGIMV